MVRFSAFPPTSTLDRCIPLPSFCKTHLGILSAEKPCERRFLTRSTVARRDQPYRAAGRVALGSYPPRAPTDPDVRALAHPVPRPTASPSAMVPAAIRSSYGDMLIEPRSVRHVSLDRVCRSTLRFPPQGPPRQVPLLQQYYQSVTTSCRPSRRASLPSLGGTSVSLVTFAPRRTSAPP